MKTTGQILKDKRESLNLTISEVALSTKINPKILSAMESGDSGRLPSQTFLKGFVKSYAGYLKLDQDQVLKTFIEEMNPGVSDAAANYRTEPTVQSRREVTAESNSVAKAVGIGAILVLIGLIFGVRELINKYQKETEVEEVAKIQVTPLEIEAPVEAKTPAPTEVAPTEVASEEIATTESEPTVTAEASKASEPEKTKAEVEAEVIESAAVAEVAKTADPVTEDINPLSNLVANFKFEVPKTEEPKRESAAAEAVVPLDKKAKETLPTVENTAEKPEEKATEKIAEAKVADSKTDPKAEIKPDEKKEEPKTLVKNEIIIEALDKVDVRMDIKGSSKRLSLGPTEVHTIRASGPVKFDFSDGGAINIILNGRERGVPGDLGKPKQVNIP